MKTIIFDLDDTLYDTSQRLDAVTPNFETMKLFPEAKNFLKKKNVKTILLTFGNKELQEKKIEVLGIKNFFSKIYICDSNQKKEEALRTILRDADSISPEETYVVGDRIDAEIRYGNMLGLTTIHLKRGKYAKLEPKDDFEKPTFTISSLSELEDIIS